MLAFTPLSVRLNIDSFSKIIKKLTSYSVSLKDKALADIRIIDRLSTPVTDVPPFQAFKVYKPTPNFRKSSPQVTPDFLVIVCDVSGGLSSLDSFRHWTSLGPKGRVQLAVVDGPNISFLNLTDAFDIQSNAARSKKKFTPSIA